MPLFDPVNEILDAPLDHYLHSLQVASLQLVNCMEKLGRSTIGKGQPL